jgi:hypothetical protein
MFDYNYNLMDSIQRYRQFQKEMNHMQRTPPKKFGEAMQKRRKKKKVRG